MNSIKVLELRFNLKKIQKLSVLALKLCCMSTGQNGPRIVLLVCLNTIHTFSLYKSRRIHIPFISICPEALILKDTQVLYAIVFYLWPLPVRGLLTLIIELAMCPCLCVIADWHTLESCGFAICRLVKKERLCDLGPANLRNLRICSSGMSFRICGLSTVFADFRKMFACPPLIFRDALI
jgi:hypothetical protein